MVGHCRRIANVNNIGRFKLALEVSRGPVYGSVVHHKIIAVRGMRPRQYSCVSARGEGRRANILQCSGR